MRLFQFGACYPDYFRSFEERYPAAAAADYGARLALLLEDGFNAVYILKPVVDGDAGARFTVATDRTLQLRWAQEHGMATRDLTEVLLAQIEEHRAEVVYSLYPVRFDSMFVRRLPGCVRTTVCWLASPTGRADLSAYTLRVSNFPHFIDSWRARGWRAELFSAAFDPVMIEAGASAERTVDVAFAGQYSTLHTRRNELLDACATLAGRRTVVFALLAPRRKPLLNLPFIRRFPGPLPALPRSLRAITVPPVYGREMYGLLRRAKIVLNAAVDVAGPHRGNMRCFEAMGCGACMVSDEGLYPEGFVPGEHFVPFRDADDARRRIERLLEEPEEAARIGRAGQELMMQKFSKALQWKRFCELVAGA